MTEHQKVLALLDIAEELISRLNQSFNDGRLDGYSVAEYTDSEFGEIEGKVETIKNA